MRSVRSLLVVGALTATALLLPGGSAAADVEPNNTIAASEAIAVGVGGALSGQIGPGGDVDVYRFTAVAGNTYTVETLNVATGLGSLNLTAETVDGIRIANASGSAGCNATGNSCNRIQFVNTYNGSVYLTVRSPQSSRAGAYRVRVLPRYDQGLTRSGAGEPDDTIALSGAIPIGVAGVARTIAPKDPAYSTAGGDVDVYRFAAAAGRIYTVETFNVATDLGSLDLVATDADGVRIVSVIGSGGCNATGNACNRTQFASTYNGPVYLTIRSPQSSRLGTYSVRVLPRYDQGLAHDSTGEPDDTIALSGPISLGAGGALTRTIYVKSAAYRTAGGDVDVYRFSAVAGRTYTVDVLNITGALGSMNLAISNADGTDQVFRSGSGGCNGSGPVCDRLQLTVSRTGPYFVTAGPTYHTRSGGYSVRVT